MILTIWTENPLKYLRKPEILRISRSNKEIDVASVLNNINVNDIENLHFLIGDSNDTETISVKPDEKTTKKITEKPSTNPIQNPKEEVKNCFIFDEETFELVNLCDPESTPEAINSTKSILELNTTTMAQTVVLNTTEAPSNFTDV